MGETKKQLNIFNDFVINITNKYKKEKILLKGQFFQATFNFFYQLLNISLSGETTLSLLCKDFEDILNRYFKVVKEKEAELQEEISTNLSDDMPLIESYVNRQTILNKEKIFNFKKLFQEEILNLTDKNKLLNLRTNMIFDGLEINAIKDQIIDSDLVIAAIKDVYMQLIHIILDDLSVMRDFCSNDSFSETQVYLKHKNKHI